MTTARPASGGVGGAIGGVLPDGVCLLRPHSAGFALFDDFIRQSPTAGRYGDTDWQLTNISTAPTLTVISGLTGAPGLLRMHKSAGASGDGGVLHHGVSTRPIASGGDVGLEVEARLRHYLNTGSTAVWVGLANAAAIPAAGVHFAGWLYDPSAAAVWRYVCSNGGGITATSSSISPSTSVFVNLGVRRKSASEFQFFRELLSERSVIEREEVGSITTNLPSVTMTPVIGFQLRGAVTGGLEVDFYNLGGRIARS